MLLKKYNINNKIIGVTRDNTSSINKLVDELKDTYNILNNKCVTYILNLINNNFLEYTFFINKNTKEFKNTITNILNNSFYLRTPCMFLVIFLPFFFLNYGIIDSVIQKKHMHACAFFNLL